MIQDCVLTISGVKLNGFMLRLVMHDYLLGEKIHVHTAMYLQHSHYDYINDGSL